MVSSAADRIPTDGLLDALLSSSTYGVAAIDLDGRVVMWNRGSERIFGWDRSEVLGDVLPVIPPEHRDGFWTVVHRVASGEAVEDLTMEHLTRDGGRVEVLLSLRPVRAGPGAEPLILGVATERDADVDREQLARRVALLEYQLAETQLPPHFLFNALNAVGTLMRRDDREHALTMLANLGDVLRHSLRYGPEDTIPLREEMEVLRTYLELERGRFEEALEIRVNVEPSVREALVPVLLLQPLVENAIKHGLVPAGPPGRLSLDARPEGGRLVLRVEDDGVGIGPEAEGRPVERIGLQGTRLRLNHLYGEDGLLRLEPRPDGGTVARVEIPLTRADG